MQPHYVFLAQWARPQDVEPSVVLSTGSPFRRFADAFQKNIDRIRALAVLPGVAAAHAYGPAVDLFTGAQRVEASHNTEWVKMGTESLFGSVVIGGWTAFEVLCGDLWVAVVNRAPLLGVRALDAEPLPDDEPQLKESKSRKTVSVVAQRLLDPKFDLRQGMGDVLKDEFQMTTFQRIASAYNRIFPTEKAADIVRDKGIRSMSAVRNVLVHNAGLADPCFVRQVRGDERFSGIKDGDPIKLDGELAVQLIQSARTQGYELIRLVDSWCEKHAAATPLPTP